MNDLHPSRFLGCAWGKAAACELRLTEAVRLWDEDQRLLALCRCGEDMSGDLLPGASSYQRWLTHDAVAPTAVVDEATCCASLSSQALARELVGSVWGEHPKFTAYSEVAPGRFAHVLVKFSLSLNNAIAQRWSDLLIAESMALQAFAEAGLPSAIARIASVFLKSNASIALANTAGLP